MIELEIEQEAARLRALVDHHHGIVRVAPRSTPAYTANPPPSPAHLPGAVRFLEHEIDRVPVLVSADAWEALIAGNDQSRRIPRALEEALATIAEVKQVLITCVEKQGIAPVGSDEVDPVTGGAPRLVKIVAEGFHPAWTHEWHIGLADLCRLHPDTHEPTLAASRLAEQMLAEYPHRGKGQ